MPESPPPRTASPSAVLFLGDHSPYGLSVARAILSSRLKVLSIVVPSPNAYARTAARAGPSAAASSGVAGARGRLRRALSAAARSQIGRFGAAAGRILGPGRGDVPGGAPIPPFVLDPGTTAPDLTTAAAASGTGWHEVDEIRSDAFLATVAGRAPDLLCSAAFPLIFGERLLAVPALGSVNFHPSLLPRCRGCHPIFWTLASGESTGGVTAHFMTRNVDAGDVIAQIPLPLTDEDDYESLYNRAMGASERLVGMVETFFLSGRRQGVSQDHGRATYFHEDGEEDHRIRWAERSASEVVALARTREAFALLRRERLGVLKAVESGGARAPQPADETRAPRRATDTEQPRGRSQVPGSVVSLEGDALVVAAREGAVAVRSVVFRGRMYGGGDLARRLGVTRGEVLG